MSPPLEEALKIANAKSMSVDTEQIRDAYLCDLLSVSPGELRDMSDDELVEHVGYREGLALARIAERSTSDG